MSRALPPAHHHVAETVAGRAHRKLCTAPAGRVDVLALVSPSDP